MSMMGELKFFLGLQVYQSPRGIFISQSQYAIELLKKHGLDECVSMSTPMATKRLDVDLQGTPTDQTTYRCMIRGLMYLTASHPDIAFATFVCARYQARPTVKYLKEVKRIFRTSGGLQFLGGKLVSWCLKKQDCTEMSNAEAEYSAIAISCNPVQHSKTKHIDIRYHFIKEHVEKGTVEIYFVGTEYQLADLFTKALPKERFEYLVHRIGRHKDKVGMQIPDWMITEEMKHTKHYRMSRNPKMDAAESSAPKRSTVICFHLPERRSTRLTPPAPAPTVDKADEMILKDTLQIEKTVKGLENVIDDSLHLRNDEPNIPGTRLELMSDKENPKVEITNDDEVEITNVVIPVNVNKDEEEITDKVYELKRREKRKIVER
ncbi:hypothetical protein Tco_0674852 [Tanacetum coccineum]